MKKLQTRMGQQEMTPSNAIPGFWVSPFGDHTSGIPAASDPPTGCVLPDLKCKRPATRFRALDMFPLNLQWHILSKGGVYTYKHSNELIYGRRVLFIPIDEWPNAYEVRMTEPVAKSDIAKEFGKEAMKVAPVSYDAICLQLTRFDGWQGEA